MNPAKPVSLWPDPAHLGTATDLYELTMMAGHHAAGLWDAKAVFELFVRKLPPKRSYLVFAGLEQAVADIAALAFSRDQIDYLKSLDIFEKVDPGFFDRLLELRFAGDLWSVPEGTVVFAGEPLVRVEAPLPLAQWIETHLLASLNYPTLVATKASRLVEAAAGREVVDFGARRGHGPHAAFLAARAAYIGGCAGTSHVESARRLGISASGTMAHAWVQAFPDEAAAFKAFAEVFGSRSTYLVDTYQPLAGIRISAEVEPAPAAIRIDSGDLVALSHFARKVLDDHGRTATKIIAAGDLDELLIAELVGQGAPIDVFGVGTQLITSADAPALSMVYKLVELNGRGCFKLSSGKRTYPMAKQIHRRVDDSGAFACDFVSSVVESPEGHPLLVPILSAGRPVYDWPDLSAIRARTRDQLRRLPQAYRRLTGPAVYPIEYSEALQSKARELGVI